MLKRKRGVGSAGGGVKEEVVRRVGALADDVGRLVPECGCGRFLCPWDSLRKKMAAVARHREDESRLRSLAKGGKPLPRAFAASLLQAATGIEGMAPFKVEGRTHYFAPQAGINPKAMLGVQNHHVPGLRLLGLSLVGGRGRYVLYAWEGRTVAKQPGEAAPAGFVDDLARGIPYTLRHEGDAWSCAHAGSAPHLGVSVPGGASVRVCLRCTREDTNLAVHIGNRILPPAGQRLAKASFHPALRCRSKSCSVPESWEVDGEKREAYARGEVADREILTRELGRLRSRIEEAGVYVAAGRCYESDGDAFLAALQGTATEREALRAVLPEEGLQLSDATTGQLLEVVWPEHAREAVAAISGKEAADRLLAAMPKAGPQQVLAAADQERRAEKALAGLPRFGRLPPLAAMVDTAVRAHRAGDPQALRTLEAGKDHRTKAIRYAILLHLGQEKAVDWQFNAEEKELGRFLRGRVTPLLTAEGDVYRDALQEVLTLSGSGESLP
jgi:hypothetical protein